MQLKDKDEWGRTLHPIADWVYVSSWDRWEDPGDYPSGAGSGPLPDGEPYPEDIEGSVVYFLTAADKAILEQEYAEWEKVRGTKGHYLEEAGELLGAFTDNITVDYNKARLVDVALFFVQEGENYYAIIVPTHWEVDGQDWGRSESCAPNELKKAMEYIQKHKEQWNLERT